MKVKKLLAVILAVALIGTMSSVAFAANRANSDSQKERPAMSERQKPQKVELTDEQKAEKTAEMKAKRGERAELTDEQKAEMKAKRGERTELTDEQKAERLAESKEKLAQALADGKITQEQYDEMITAIENGEMPMGRVMNGQGRGGMGAPKGMSKFGGRMGSRSGNPSTDTQQ